MRAFCTICGWLRELPQNKCYRREKIIRDNFYGEVIDGALLKKFVKRHRIAGRREKGIILQELCDSSDYHKKHAIRLLNKAPKRTQRKIKTGRPNWCFRVFFG